MSRLELYATAILLGLLLAAGHAQEGPDSEELAATFAAGLPAAWSLEEFTVEATENYGTSVEPDVRNRFVAVVALEEDTFSLERREGPFTFVRAVAQAGETRNVYGISASIRTGGAWRTEFSLETDPMQGLGHTRSTLGGRIIVLGSEEEAAYWAQLEAEAAAEHQAELARRARQEELRESDRQAELAEAAHEVRLREERQRAEREASVARLAHDEEMRAREREQRAEAEAQERAALAELAQGLVDDVRDELAVSLPGYWELTSLTIEASSISGSYDRPDIEQRFVAEVSLRVDTFVMVDADEAASFVRPVATAGETRQVFGTAALSPPASPARRGGWELDVEIDNREGLSIGQPRDHFPRRVIALGSQEEIDYREQLEAEAAAAQQAELERRSRQEELSQQEHLATLAERNRQEELEAQERQAELARLAYDEEAAQARHQAELARLAHEAKMREEERQQAERLAALQRSAKEEQLTALEADLASEDGSKRRAALESALANDDLDVQYLALADILSNKSVLTVEDTETSEVISLQLESIDTESGVISASSTFRGSQYVGSLHGNRLALEATEVARTFSRCSLSLTLTTVRTMEGRLVCPDQPGYSQRDRNSEVRLDLF